MVRKISIHSHFAPSLVNTASIRYIAKYYGKGGSNIYCILYVYSITQSYIFKLWIWALSNFWSWGITFQNSITPFLFPCHFQVNFYMVSSMLNQGYSLSYFWTGFNLLAMMKNKTNKQKDSEYHSCLLSTKNSINSKRGKNGAKCKEKKNGKKEKNTNLLLKDRSQFLTKIIQYWSLTLHFHQNNILLLIFISVHAFF